MLTDRSGVETGDRPEVITGEPVVPLPFLQAVVALGGCALRVLLLLVKGRIHQPSPHLGQLIRFADGTSSQVYRETVVPASTVAVPAVLVVGFRLRRVHHGWAHALFRLESELNTVLFAGFAGFVSKLWLRHDQNNVYRGVYQWDGAESAVAYVRALWWPLALVSEKDTIRYAVLPGCTPDKVLADPGRALRGPDGWWQPV